MQTLVALLILATADPTPQWAVDQLSNILDYAHTCPNNEVRFKFDWPNPFKLECVRKPIKPTLEPLPPPPKVSPEIEPFSG